MHAAAQQPARGHHFEDPAFREMYLTLAWLGRQFRSRPWPANTNDVSPRLSRQTLWKLATCKFVKVKGGTLLSWNQPQINAALASMPTSLKSGTSTPVVDLPEPAEPGEAEPPSELGSYRLDLVESEDQLLAISDNPVFSSPDQQAAVAIDIEGGPERIYLIQVATAEGVV